MASRLGFRSRKTAESTEGVRPSASSGDELSRAGELKSSEAAVTPEQLKRATRTRMILALFSASCLFVTVIFLILVEIGNTYNKRVLTDIYFLKLDLSNIVPASIPDSVLINSIAQTMGLHDFYQVGLWGFCEGYNGAGVQRCSKPQNLYWFNPVEILLDELLAGATIALPAEINDVLALIKKASQWMFGLFLTGSVTSFVMMFIAPLSLYSRWASIPIAILTFISALATTIATVLATVMFVIFRKVATGVGEINLGARIGEQMFAFMWIASAFSIISWIVQCALCCCCTSRRDVKKGKKRGSAAVFVSSGAEPTGEKPNRRRRFGILKSKE